MNNENNSYRIRTEVGSNSPNVLNVKLNQTFEFLNILSLRIGQKNLYKMPASSYGVVCGRVLLGGKSFGIQNAKVSIFIPKDTTVFDVKDDILYTYSSVDSVNYDGVRYNLLPSYIDNDCHQNVGTMFEKEYVLDNNDVIRIFDTYYTYTTTTNNAGDYFIYGVPVGQHTLHVDVDLSDIGKLSVRPHDMIGQGYNIDQFESPNKFKADKNLNILPQIKSQDKPLYIYPFWGDTSEDDTNAMITRADIEIDYKFEPTAVFIGSIVTDKGSNSISHKCVPDDLTGKMSELVTGEGMIEMIRKTFDGKVEQFSVKGNRLIDGDGVWCYQVPMNLDYVCMDEFGNIVPTDNPENGIPTRARVRFRISMDENPMDDSARKRARFLIPNNPRLTDDYPNFQATHEPDYEFGTYTKEESYRDMFWNNVYTVKSYIPRLQKRTAVSTRKYTGIKMTNHAGDNNPMPYNNLSIKMRFVYRFLCVLLVIFIHVVAAINTVLALIGYLFMGIGDLFWGLYNAVPDWKWFGEEVFGWLRNPLKDIACWFYKTSASMLIDLGEDFCDDGNPSVNYMPGPGIVKSFINDIKIRCSRGGCLTESIKGEPAKCDKYQNADNDTDRLINCVQNALAQDNEVTSFDFQNDWVNGVLYAPLWYRKIKPKRRLFFGLIKVGGVDDWCDGNSSKMAGRDSLFTRGLKLYQTCAQQKSLSSDRKRIMELQYSNDTYDKSNANCYHSNCHRRSISVIQVDKGIIIRKETKYGEYVYYYKSIEYSNDKMRNALDGSSGDIKILFATDLVLLGSLNDCDEKGVPQFFKHLNETTYQMPPDLLSISWMVKEENVTVSYNGNLNDSSQFTVDENTVHSEYTGADWGNAGFDQWYHKDNYSGKYIKDGEKEHDNGGVFYGIDCNFSYVKPKSCVNLSRACEFGVTLDQSISFLDASEQESIMAPDGYISYDEIYNPDARAMFATMNGNRLRERQDPKTGFPTYDFNYLYPENFDGTLRNFMNEVNHHPGIGDNGYPNGGVTYKDNHRIESSSDAYLRFRYGFDPSTFGVTFYDNDVKLGWFTNSDISPINKNRFPRYENSFYFYFGLKSGKTAIDKFRKNYYSECRNDEASENSLSIEYQANGWCNNEPATMRDGYIKFDLCNLDMPCSISFDERNHDGGGYDETYTDITDCKIYIGSSDTQFVGYNRLYVDDDNKYTRRNRLNSGTLHAPTLPNGYYVVTITDANGEQYRQNITFETEKLKYNTTSTSFTLTNDEMLTTFPESGGRSTNQRVAEDTTHTSTNTNYIRDIGGYITVSLVTYQNEPLTDNFTITVSPYDETMEWYRGTVYSKINGVENTTGVPLLSNTDGEYVFPVPMGNEYYTVTVAEYCPINDRMSDNAVLTRVYVNEPLPFKMFINGIDSELLKNFRVGYQKDVNGVINAPYSGYNETDGVRSDLPGSVRGWLNINDIGVTKLLEYRDDISYTGDVANTVNALSPSNNTIYNFTEEYTFQESDVNKSLNTYSTVPLVSEMGSGIKPKYVRVKRNGTEGYGYGRGEANYDPFDEVTWIYQLVNNGTVYTLKFNNNEPATDISIREYFEMNTDDNQNKRDVIDVLNSIIQKRMSLVQEMIGAFWMYDTNEENKTVSITFQTNETPVKTLVYYIPDETNRVSKLNSETRYIILDPNKDENTITSFSKPSIIKNSDATKPIFTDLSIITGTHDYKLPPHCGIKNNMNVTVPSTLTNAPFENINGIVSAMSALPGGMDNMFGFHVIDKRPFTKANIWVPLNEQPIYWPDVEADSAIDASTPSNVANFVEEGTFSMNGCVSGYFYNGFSTSTQQKAQFITQKATNDIGAYTITVIDGTTTPDEFAVPTKRLMYRPAPEGGYIANYNDFFKEDGQPYEGFDIQETPGVDTSYRYISYDGNTNYLTISDERASFNENLYPTANFGIPEDTVVAKGMQIKPVFSGIETNVNYTVINGIYPLYRKVYNDEGYLPTDTLNMTYNASLPSNNLIIPTGNDVKRIYYIGFTSDGKYRGISPVYEVSQVNVSYDDSSIHPIVSVNYNTDTDYYLLHYRYQIVLTYDMVIDGHTTQNTSISQYISQGSTAQYSFMDVDINVVSNVKVYIKDITGIRRTTNI